MRIYTIDQLREADTSLIRERLGDLGLEAGIEGIYWLPVSESMLTPLQQEHRESCGPYCLALEVEETALHLELLVRARSRITCECLAFASEQLRDRMIAYLEDTLNELEVVF